MNVAFTTFKCGGYPYIPMHTTQYYSKYFWRLLYRISSCTHYNNIRETLFLPSSPTYTFSLCYNSEVVCHLYFCLNEFWLLPKINPPLSSTHGYLPLKRIKNKNKEMCFRHKRKSVRVVGTYNDNHIPTKLL